MPPAAFTTSGEGRPRSLAPKAVDTNNPAISRFDRLRKPASQADIRNLN
jgi:hypothetical protein